MTSMAFGVSLCAAFIVLAYPVEAQQPKKVPRIGYLTAARLSAITARTDAFQRGLRELGYVEGQNIIVEWRSAEAKADRLPFLVAELVRLNVKVIVSAGSSVTRPAKEATSTIPIVMTQDRDPVGSGFVASLARPGANVTGLSRAYPELSGKRLELLKELVPKLSRVALLWTSTEPAGVNTLKQTKRAAEGLGVQLQYLDILSPKDIETAFQEATRGRADAVLMMVSGPFINFQLAAIAKLAIRSRLPAMHSIAFVEAGGLMSYSVNVPDLDRRAATYVDKILKGAKPADLPVEQPMKFEFVVNLNTAKQLNLTIPPSLLYRADRVIK